MDLVCDYSFEWQFQDTIARIISNYNSCRSHPSKTAVRKRTDRIDYRQQVVEDSQSGFSRCTAQEMDRGAVALVIKKEVIVHKSISH